MLRVDGPVCDLTFPVAIRRHLATRTLLGRVFLVAQWAQMRSVYATVGGELDCTSSMPDDRRFVFLGQIAAHGHYGRSDPSSMGDSGTTTEPVPRSASPTPPNHTPIHTRQTRRLQHFLVAAT